MVAVDDTNDCRHLAECHHPAVPATPSLADGKVVLLVIYMIRGGCFQGSAADLTARASKA
jgi:hypothetical protein